MCYSVSDSHRTRGETWIEQGFRPSVSPPDVVSPHGYLNDALMSSIDIFSSHSFLLQDRPQPIQGSVEQACSTQSIPSRQGRCIHHVIPRHSGSPSLGHSISKQPRTTHYERHFEPNRMESHLQFCLAATSQPSNSIFRPRHAPTRRKPTRSILTVANPHPKPK